MQQRESHGGIYLVDLESGETRLVVDWDDADISWEGRGQDRGLRGIALHADHAYVAASDEIFVYDRDFGIVKSFRNPYLKHCHEIHACGTRLLVTSTGFDSVLIFDLLQERFIRGYCIRRQAAASLALDFRVFDPGLPGGPAPGDSVHVNNVFQAGHRIGVCGTGLRNLLYIADGRLVEGPPVPRGTHNARPYGDGILANDTAASRLALFDRNGALVKSIPAVRYREDDLLMAHLPRDHARQGFTRGLCVAEDDRVIGGTSPSTISLYDLRTSSIVKSVNLTMDIRNSVHGLEIWPHPLR